jgi:ubiquitin-protein ligase
MAGFFNKKKQKSGGSIDPVVRSERLLREYDLIFKCFRSHPQISVKEVFGTPPEKYHIVLRVDGLAQTGMSIEAKNEHVVEILLPADYPNGKPICTAVTPIYHPNISSDTIDITKLFTPDLPLADLIVGIGQMIVFQRYSIDDAINADALQWALRNKSMLPLSSVDLQYAPSPEAPATVPSIELGGEDDKKHDALAPVENTEKTENIKISKRDFRCPSCGNKNHRTANYCAQCGQKLATAHPGVKKAKAFFLASMIIVPIIIITAGFFAVMLHWDRVISSGILSPQKSSPAPDISPEIPAQEKETAADIKPQEPLTEKPNNEISEPPKPQKKENHSATRAETNKIRRSDKHGASGIKREEEATEKPTLEHKKTINPVNESAGGPSQPLRQGNERQRTEKINNTLKLANLYFGIGSYDDAIAQFLDVLMLDPKNQEARDGLVKARETKKATLGK